RSIRSGAAKADPVSLTLYEAEISGSERHTPHTLIFPMNPWNDVPRVPLATNVGSSVKVGWRVPNLVTAPPHSDPTWNEPVWLIAWGTSTDGYVNVPTSSRFRNRVPDRDDPS